MRLLHVVPSYIPAWRYGGPIRSVHGLCKALAALGHDVHVFTTNRDGPGELDVPIESCVDLDGVKVRYFDAHRFRRLFWAPRMRVALDREAVDFDIMHIHSVYLWPTVAAGAVARRRHIPYVLSPRGMLVRDFINMKSRWKKKLWLAVFGKRIISKAAGIHFTSTREREAFAGLGLQARMQWTIPNGVELGSTPATAAPAAPSRPYLLFLGRVNWEKGLDRLIRALSYVPDCDLIVAGNDEEGYQAKLELLASRVGVHERVRFLGPVFDAPKDSLIRGALALVLPSYSENFGNVVLEAMALGCPVVVTPEVGAADLLRESGAGIVVDGAPQALGSRLREITANPAELKALGSASSNAIATRYSWDAIARRMLDAYTQILEVSRADA
jgi:glycosyltransferase involved in cell wall biosynthesis